MSGSWVHFSDSAVKVHDSQTYINMEMTRACISFTFDPRDMLLSVQFGFSFVRAAVAYLTLETAFGFEPSSEATAPSYKYLKHVTIPSFCLFALISLWTPLVLFGISLVFSALIYILYLVQVLLSLSTTIGLLVSSLSLLERLCHRQSGNISAPVLTFPSCSSRASDMILSRNMLKRAGDRRHPCLTPNVVLNHSPMLQFMEACESF